MKEISRRMFISKSSLFSASLFLLYRCKLWSTDEAETVNRLVNIETPLDGEDIFAYILRKKGKMDITLYRQIVGAANEFKEGDQIQGIAAQSESARQNARILLANTKLIDLIENPLFRDGIFDLIEESTVAHQYFEQWTMRELKTFILQEPEEEIKAIMPGLSSDIIACVVKLMSNEELVQVGQKVFNVLPNSNIGSKGYLSARVQPNSPTDNIEDIVWQVFNAWSFAVGDLVLGTNPVSSEVESVAEIEKALFDIISTFQLEEVIPNCVLSHIDIQAEAEEKNPGKTGIWFQSIAGTEKANQTFDVSIQKMLDHINKRNGRYGLYAETGQGADFTNGHGEGFDMVVHEARKYGFLRALKMHMEEGKSTESMPWVFVNDVAGFIGPEVFRTKEQLVRCCLEDTVMGKLHGLTIGLDICSTLHMDVSLDDLNWCIDQVMPANPAYLMALPTKNDPMLGYLTTAFNDHVRVREKFRYKVNDKMWDFFKRMEVIDEMGNPTNHFGDPIWIYYQYRREKNDQRSQTAIFEEGKACIERIRQRGVNIAQGYGENIWDLQSELEREVSRLYEDAKQCIWTEISTAFVASIPYSVPIGTNSKDRIDYVYHPHTGEELNPLAIQTLEQKRELWESPSPDIQIIISDGLNANALMDEGHLEPYLTHIRHSLEKAHFSVAQDHIVIRHGRVRAGYACGEILFGTNQSSRKRGVIHLIGERPGSLHHSYSAYLTVSSEHSWSQKALVDHDITKVVSGISDSSLLPEIAATDTLRILKGLFGKDDGNG